ncbi:MAG: MOSC domain-containing protein [Alphaproteobacteria bacterium]|nr:MOSC domain-containing protein [Alphaproteobacteria bacterium]
MTDGKSTWRGVVAHLHLTPRDSQPMQAREALELVAGQGIVGDRYKDGQGFYSNKPEEGRQITLFELETLEALKRDHDIDFAPHEHRRNVTTSGVPLNHLVGRRLRIGAALLEATRLSTPCRHIVDVTGKEVFKPLINRSGLNCRILVGGIIRVGDTIEPA